MQNIFAISKVFYGSHLILTCLIAFAAQAAGGSGTALSVSGHKGCLCCDLGMVEQQQ